MDLTTAFPRSPKATFGGLVQVPRMVDKARAKMNGQLGEYIFPCPLDNMILEFLNLDSDTFSNSIMGKEDFEITEWIEDLLQNKEANEIFDLNIKLLGTAPETPEKQKKFKELLAKINPARTDIKTWVELIDLEEGRT